MGDTMATFDYAASAATASRLLAKFGQDVTLSKTTPGDYDPVTGESSDPVTVAQTASAVLLDYSAKESGARFADGSQVMIGDKKCLIEAKGLNWPPDALTVLTDAAGTAWQIDQVRELAPAGAPVVMYTANATR